MDSELEQAHQVLDNLEVPRGNPPYTVPERINLFRAQWLKGPLASPPPEFGIHRLEDAQWVIVNLVSGAVAAGPGVTVDDVFFDFQQANGRLPMPESGPPNNSGREAVGGDGEIITQMACA